MSNNFLKSNMLYFWQTKYTTLIYIPFFHIIATSLYTFLPAFWKFENSPAVELRSSQPKTLTHCFLNCLRCLITLSTQLMLHKSGKMVIGGCQIRAMGGVWKNFPPNLCNCVRCEASSVGRAFSCKMMRFRPGRL